MAKGAKERISEKLAQFFKDPALWRSVVAPLLVVIVLAIAGIIWAPWKPKHQREVEGNTPAILTGPNSSSQIAVGDDANQTMIDVRTGPNSTSPIVIGPGKIDMPQHIDRGTHITVEAGGTLNIIDYQDGVAQSEELEVRIKFAEGRVDYEKGRYEEAIEKLMYCLELEEDHEKRGALNLQIGNCYYRLQEYIKASEYYGAGLRESRKAGDREGEAANLNNMGITYKARPASSREARGENIRSAIDCYNRALEIRKKDEYPVQYATTQNNLGGALTYLPSATPKERASNVREAVECYKRALEIWERGEYPQDYCQTAANMGMILADIDKAQACHWLKEAYSLREFLPQQGREIEELMERVCEGN